MSQEESAWLLHCPTHGFWTLGAWFSLPGKWRKQYQGRWVSGDEQPLLWHIYCVPLLDNARAAWKNAANVHFLVLSDKGWELPRGPWEPGRLSSRLPSWHCIVCPEAQLAGLAGPGSLHPGRCQRGKVASTRYSPPARTQGSSVPGGFRVSFVLYSTWFLQSASIDFPRCLASFLLRREKVTFDLALFLPPRSTLPHPPVGGGFL